MTPIKVPIIEPYIILIAIVFVIAPIVVPLLLPIVVANMQYYFICFGFIFNDLKCLCSIQEMHLYLQKVQP